MQRSSSFLIALACAALGTQCKKESPQAAPSTRPSASAPAPDRLAPGELATSGENLFGLPVPRGLTVTGQFSKFGIAAGNLRTEAVANYVRDHVVVERVEIGPMRTVFPGARIKQASSDRTFRIEVMRDGTGTRLTVWDTTPPPPAPLPATRISDEEAWRRAGYTPDGRPLHPEKLE